ncbi:MAG: hypothetical protein WAM60_04550 [Candidatus Promineifilaceae bacterium]
MIKAIRQITYFLAGALFILLAACTPSMEGTVEKTADIATHPPLEPTYAAQIAELRSPDVPQLPFPDNPDPSQCGIPTKWGGNNQAWLNGIYEGKLVQPVVLLYDSHLRFNITAEAPHGSEVEIILYQNNPVTDYYLVKIVGADTPNEGWVPAPFLSFNPLE